MWSGTRLRRWIPWVSGKMRVMRISTKIVLIYAVLLFLTLFAINGIMVIGGYYSLYRQAERSLEISMHRTLEKMEAGAPLDEGFWRDDPVLPGVVLRVTDERGKIVLENDSHFPPIERIRQSIRENPPIWANKHMMVADTPNSTIYYATDHISRHGREYDLHFFRVITMERRFLTALGKFLLFADLIGFLAALAAGYFMSNRILRPIREITRAARRIEVERMDSRIEVPPSKDEVTELADTFNHMLDRLQTGLRQQQRFVSDASHELRTPVTVILGYSDLLSRWGRENPEVLDEGIESIRSEAEDMQQLIEKLLFLARTDQKRQVLHKEEMELSELVEDIMRKMEMVEKEHEISLSRNDKGRIYADPVLMRQMLRIFLDNAVKYTPAGGRISLSSEHEGNCIHLAISDTGIGIAPEHQEKVFERFYRVDASRSKAEGGVSGTGLGLSIARWIAEQHGIELRLESETGKGTTIHLWLPVGTGNEEKAGVE